MASKVEIANRALINLGASTISSLTEDTENANAVNNVYDTSLRALLSECQWNFATKRRLLSQPSVSMDWEFDDESYVYSRPADVVRIFSTNDDEAIWREEGDYIISDTSGLGVRYVYYLDNPDKYPAFFTEALIDLLTANISFKITNSRSLYEEYLEKYTKISLPKAKGQNGQIGTQQYMKDDAWELAKNGDDNSNA